MYETFYQLSTNPFRLTPDSNFCFAHASHKRAHAYLEYALKLGEGFIIVTGRPGTGKTTLIESFVKGVNMTEVTAERIAASNLEATDLLRAVAYAFGIEAEGLDKATLRLRVEQYFIGQQQSGRRVLLFIDEAQGLGHAALEELRLLADQQNRGRPLLQLFLVGQDSLRSLMSAPDMEQLQQRVIGTCFLEPLSLIDTRGYVDYRLRQANWTGDPEITGAAIAAIYQQSRGVPRHINKTCTRLLLHGVMEGKHKLDEADVLSIAADLREEQLGPLEINEAEDPAAVARMPTPELENGSVSLAELALRADPEEAQRAPEPANIPAAAAIRPATRLTPSQPATRHAQPAIPNWQSGKGAKIPARWWLDILARGRALQQDGIEWARNVTDRLRAAGWPGVLQQNGIDWARNFAGRWQLADQPRVAQGAVIVVTLSLVAILAITPQNEGSDSSVNLATYEGPIEVLPAQVPAKIASASIMDSPQQAPAAPAARDDGPELIQPTVVASADVFMEDSAAETYDVPGPEVLQLAALEQTTHMLPAEQEVSDSAPPDDGPAPVTVARASSVSEAVPVDARPAPVPDPREQKISELVSLARQALKENRLLIPSGNNAYRYYREVLALQPENPVAGDGIQEIVRRYTRYATRAFERLDDDKARMYIGRGLHIRPQDRQLLALQERLDNRIQMLEAARKPVPVQQVATPPAEPADTAAPESKNFLLRLKDFFTRAQ